MVAAIAGVAAAGIGAAGSLAGGSASAGAVSDASAASIAEQQREYNQTRADQMPWLTAGQGALGQTQNLLGLNGQAAATAAMGQFQASPGYQYQVQQGLSAVDNGAASQGLLHSGNTIRAEQTLGTNLANQDFSNYYSRLAGIAQTGQNTAQGLGILGQQSAAGQAQTLASQGSSLASIYGGEARGVTNAATGGLSNLAYGNTLGGYQGSNLGSGFTGAGVSTAGTDPFSGF